MRFLVVIFMLYSGVAHASVRCDDLLAAASSEIDASTKDLSPPARAYVNLIKYYMSQSGAELNADTVDKVLNAENFINPFASQKDTLSIQVYAAIEKLRSRISKTDWQDLKLAINNYLNVEGETREDRQQKEDDTSYVFDLKIESEQKRDFDHRRLTVIEKNGRILVAKYDWMHLSIFEFINGDLKLLSEIVVVNKDFKSAKFLVTEDKVFLATHSERDVDVFELESDQLKPVKTLQHIAKHVEWKIAGKRKFLHVLTDMIGKDTGLKIYELVGGEIKFVQSFDAATGPAAWLSHGKMPLMSVVEYAGDTSYLKVYELQNDVFEVVSSLKLDAKELWPSLSTRVKPESILWNSSEWLVVDGRKFISLRGLVIPQIDKRDNAQGLLLFELKNEKLELKDTLAFPQANKERWSKASWVVYQGRTFLAVTYANELLIYEMNDSTIVFKSKLPGFFERQPIWNEQDETGLSISLPSSDSVIKVKVFKKLEKQRGRK